MFHEPKTDTLDRKWGNHGKIHYDYIQDKEIHINFLGLLF